MADIKVAESKKSKPRSSVVKLEWKKQSNVSRVVTSRVVFTS